MINRILLILQMNWKKIGKNNSRNINIIILIESLNLKYSLIVIILILKKLKCEKTNKL